MELETSKNLGGIGAILLIIGSLAVFGTGYAAIIDLIGVILILVALNGLAGYYRESGIIHNAVYAIVVAIVGVVVFVGMFIFVVLSWLMSLPGFPENWTDPNAITSFFTNYFTNLSNYSTLLTLAGGIIATWVVLIIFGAIAGYLTWRSLRTVGAKSGTGLIGTAGLLIFIGAILAIVLFGLILVWIGFILLAIAFFQLRPQTPQQAPPPPPS